MIDMKTIITTSLLTLSFITKADCQKIHNLAYQLQIDRQHGIYHKQDHSTQLLSDMYNNVWQIPMYFNDQRKQAEAIKFAQDWFEACKKY